MSPWVRKRDRVSSQEDMFMWVLLYLGFKKENMLILLNQKVCYDDNNVAPGNISLVILQKCQHFQAFNFSVLEKNILKISPWRPANNYTLHFTLYFTSFEQTTQIQRMWSMMILFKSNKDKNQRESFWLELTTNQDAI